MSPIIQVRERKNLSCFSHLITNLVDIGGVRWNTFGTSLALMYQKLLNIPDYVSQHQETHNALLSLDILHANHRQSKTLEGLSSYQPVDGHQEDNLEPHL